MYNRSWREVIWAGSGVRRKARGAMMCMALVWIVVTAIPAIAAIEGPAGSPSCTDNLDNDGDGLIDCADSDCTLDPSCICGQPPAVGGALLIGGDDADDHGGFDGTNNVTGWLYIEKGLDHIGPAVQNGKKLAVCLGCNGGQASGGFESGFDQSTLPGLGWTRISLTAVADITAFFAGTGTPSIGDAGIVYMPTDENNVNGGITESQLTEVNTNATLLNDFTKAGGGLFTHDESSVSNGFGWLIALLPGINVNSVSGCNDSVLNITPAGSAAFPGLTDGDVSSATPWHSWFSGNLGGLDRLVTGPCSNVGQPVVLGGVGAIQTLIDLDPALALNPVNGTHTVTATVRDAGGATQPGVAVTFLVKSGPNVGQTAPATTDQNGQAMFTYSDTGGAGVDLIVGSFGTSVSGCFVESIPARKFWDADCNNNAQPDTCDIGCSALGGECQRFPGCGQSADANPADGKPDECSVVIVCGNGRLDGQEQCDDGNTVDGDCCSSRCLFEGVATACASDGRECTDDHCDGQGTCIHPNVLDGTVCDDQDLCTQLDACLAGDCVGAPAVLIDSLGRLNNGADIEVDVAVRSLGGVLRIGKKAVAIDGTTMTADLLNLGPLSSVFDVATKAVLHLAPGATVRGSRGQATLPLPFCSYQPPACGGPALVVAPGDFLGPLAPGVYGELLVKNGGRVKLQPGAFTFCSLRTARNVVFDTDGPTTIDVAGSVIIGNESRLGPAGAGPLPVLRVGGELLRIAASARLEALVTAPASALHMGRQAVFNGTLCVERLITDKQIQLVCEHQVCDNCE